MSLLLDIYTIPHEKFPHTIAIKCSKHYIYDYLVINCYKNWTILFQPLSRFDNIALDIGYLHNSPCQIPSHYCNKILKMLYFLIILLSTVIKIGQSCFNRNQDLIILLSILDIYTIPRAKFPHTTITMQFSKCYIF